MIGPLRGGAQSAPGSAWSTTLPRFALACCSLTTPLLIFACSTITEEPITTNPPRRIVSTAPSITEWVFALGAGDRLVGVTTYCDYPPEALSKPKIGDFASPSMEAVLASRAELVLLPGGRKDLEVKLSALSVPFLVMRSSTLSEIGQSAKQLAERLGIASAGEKLVVSMREELVEIQKAARQHPTPGVLLLVGRSPGTLSDLYAVGGRSYLAELIKYAGGISIFEDSPVIYPKVSIEEILDRQPEIIVDLSLDMSRGGEASPEEWEQIHSLWSEFPSIPAVYSGRVFVTSNDLFLVPGPRLPEAVRTLSGFFSQGVK